MSRLIIESVLGKPMTKSLWTANYTPVVPVSLQDFSLEAVLPAVMYMFRWGHRRGKGRFAEVYGKDVPRKTKKVATVNGIADRLALEPTLEGFDSPTGKAILGDMLLAFSLENNSRLAGRDEPVIRVAPTHYMASWVDLPHFVGHLRFVPETLVALLADQADGDTVQLANPKTRFAIGRGFKDNVLLQAFRQGMFVQPNQPLGNQASDSFDEDCIVGLDQLITIRLAQSLQRAPDKISGDSGRISNQRPVPEFATKHCGEDMRRFIQAYSSIMPRRTFVPMLESCIAVGLSSIMTAVVKVLLVWAETNRMPTKADTLPYSFLVDASNGGNRRVRLAAEESFDHFLRMLERCSAILMTMRLLDYKASYDVKIRQSNPPSKRPFAREWLDLLGDILAEKHGRSDVILNSLEEQCLELSEAFKESNNTLSQRFQDMESQPNPAWRLGETLSEIMGRKIQVETFLSCIDSCLMINRPNGLAEKRRIRDIDLYSGKKTRDVRSLTLSDTALEMLVHLHTLKSGRPGKGHCTLSYQEFLKILTNRYGYYIDKAPPGLSVSQELLLTNRAILEKRLHDLGLMAGVNDAEQMKRLRPRFQCNETNHQNTDGNTGGQDVYAAD